MTKLRKDYVLDRWVVISAKRGKRPYQFSDNTSKGSTKCFFCPGSENLTPPEIGSVMRGGKWLIRWFNNKFPIVDKGNLRNSKPGLLISRDAYGSHEVIVETPNHSKQLFDLPPGHIAQILKVYANRINELSADLHCRYVSVFKNHGGDAGTSIIHSHSQVISLNKIPPIILAKSRKSVKKNRCVYCDVIRTESRSKRKIGVEKTAVAFAPYASRFNWEAWIFPKRHVRTIVDYTEQEYKDTAILLLKVIRKIKKLGLAYNIFLHYAPMGKDLHFHIEVCPRKAKWAGFELSTDVIVNVVPPEDAAAFYRGDIRLSGNVH